MTFDLCLIMPLATCSKGAPAIPQPVTSVLLFLEEFCRFSSISRKAIDVRLCMFGMVLISQIQAFVPSYIFDRFEH